MMCLWIVIGLLAFAFVLLALERHETATMVREAHGRVSSKGAHCPGLGMSGNPRKVSPIHCCRRYSQDHADAVAAFRSCDTRDATVLRRGDTGRPTAGQDHVDPDTLCQRPH